LNRETVRQLIDALPSWARSGYALNIPLLLVIVPVIVSLYRAPSFDTTLEVFPTMPPGNASISRAYGPGGRGIVANPGLEVSASGWKDHPACASLRRSTRQAHSGVASLACVRGRPTAPAERAASIRVALPSAGRYRAQAWVRLPRGYNGGPPRIELEGFIGSSRVAARDGDPRVRERWQLISSDYVVKSIDRSGRVLLRADPPLPTRGQVLYWDDVSMLSSNDASMPAPPRINLVSNPSFEERASAWGKPPIFKTRHSTTLAHSGDGSLRSSSNSRVLKDTNAGYTYLVFPRAGVYRAEAWVYVPLKPNVRASSPAIFLEGYSGGVQLAQRAGSPQGRGRWQQISTDFIISSDDLQGSFVLRDIAGPARPGGARRDAPATTTIYLDDANVSAPRPALPRDELGPARGVRLAFEEPQLRLEVSLAARDKNLYDPSRVTLLRSARTETLSFIAKVASDVPSDARSLAGPLRSALQRAAIRSTLRRAQASLQQLISRLGNGLPARRRAILQARANVLQGMIGAQAADVVALPSSEPKPSTRRTRREELRVQRNRQKVISRLGNGLPPRQRALVQQRADDLQRLVGAHAPDFVVAASGPSPKPTRALDRLLDKLPGPYPARIGPVWAAAAGLLCAALLLGMLFATTAVRHRGTVRSR
jgi:hypothetical protein